MQLAIRITQPGSSYNYFELWVIMATDNPLNYEASAGATHLQITDCLPDEVVQCLQNARFV